MLRICCKTSELNVHDFGLAALPRGGVVPNRKHQDTFAGSPGQQRRSAIECQLFIAQVMQDLECIERGFRDPASGYEPKAAREHTFKHAAFLKKSVRKRPIRHL